MSDHPEMEKLEQFQQGNLRGGDLLKVLRHLEDCDYCFENLPPQSPDELLNKIFKKGNHKTTQDRSPADDKFEN